MPVVRTDIPMTSRLCEQTIDAILAAYPFCRSETLTTTAFDRPIRTLVIGSGPRKVLYSAAHHANEWITTPVILKFVEDLAQAIQTGGTLAGVDARELAQLAAQLENAGNHAAFEQVMAAVSDFEKGNMRLSMVLSSLK